MNRFNQIGPLKTPSDLTEKNLTDLFSKYFEDQSLSLEILDEDQKFLEDNDNFQSLVTLVHQSHQSRVIKTEIDSQIRKCHLRIRSQRTDFNREFSIIVKTSLQYKYKPVGQD